MAKPDLNAEPFKEPVELLGAFKTDRAQFTSSAKVKLTFTIYLPGSNVPVRVRGVEFIIVDDDMDEILLGRPFLRKIGFDLNEHLRRVHPLIHDKTLDEIDPDKVKLAATKYQGLSYRNADDDPIELSECIVAGIGKDSEEAITKAFKNCLDEAQRNGISDQGLNRVRHLLKGYRKVFRIKLGPDPPADVPPLVITPVASCKPYRSPQRRYAQHQRDFIINTVRELEAVGEICKNASARWASPALAVPKPGSSKLRFTVDLRGPNSRTVPIQLAMPHLESKFQEIAGSSCFGHFDLAHGYWKVPLATESQEMMSIQTPIGVYSSRRLLQGGTDSGSHFQAVLQDKFDGRVKKMLQWIDDFLFHARNEKELLEDIEVFLEVCHEIGLKIHAEKLPFFFQNSTILRPCYLRGRHPIPPSTF